MYIIFAKIIYLGFSIPGKILNLLKLFFGYLASRFVFLFGGNIFFKEFETDINIVKNIKHQDLNIKVKLNNYWDYWRIRNFESYPINYLRKDKDFNGSDDKKIIFYEIGANTGYCSLLLSKFLENKGKVYSFEIEPTNYKTLCDNIILNKLKNITPMNIGVSDGDKISKFYYNTKFLQRKNRLPMSSMGMHSMKFDKNVHEEDFYCNSTFMTYQNIIETFKLEVPTHVYIDAYGAEENIIKSITNSDTKFLPAKVMVDIEENVKKIEESKIFKMLNSKNYQLLSFQREKGVSYLPDNLQSIFVLKK